MTSVTSPATPTTKSGYSSIRLTLREQLLNRFNESSFANIFYFKDQCTVQEVDNVVNVFTLVNSLLIGIPFSLLGGFNQEYWDWLHAAITACNPDKGESWVDSEWIKMYNRVINSVYGNVYTGLISILLSVLYYLYRPNDDVVRFRNWWNSGSKYPVLLMFLGTTLNVVLVCTLMGVIHQYVNSSSHLCAIWNPDTFARSTFATGLGGTIFFLVVVISSYVML